MADSKKFKLEELPATWAECYQMRRKLLVSFSELKDKSLHNHCSSKCNEYKRQGSTYGLLLTSLFVLITYAKYKVYKPHIPGIIIGSTFAYCFAGGVGLITGYKPTIESLGIIKEHPNLEIERVKILQKCKKY